jgi:hypothetical protein
MLSPATFIGIAKATTPVISPVQPARISGIQPLGATPAAPSGAKPPVTAAPGSVGTPPRNLPRGSLLDLSV